MPPFNAESCERCCLVCTRARKGHQRARTLLKMEWAATFGDCPWCRARQRAYGVRPAERLSPQEPDKMEVKDHR